MHLIHSHTSDILNLITITTISLVSPGPDFAIIVKNSLVYSRKTAILTAIGISLGVAIHLSYSIVGFSILADHIQILFSILKYTGTAYLLYLGYKGITAKKESTTLISASHKQDITPIKGLKSGLLVNAVNPKAALFFLSVFSALIKPDTPNVILFIYGIIPFILTVTWFTLVALFLSSKRMQKKFISYKYYIERTTGAILILIGLKLLFTS